MILFKDCESIHFPSNYCMVNIRSDTIDKLLEVSPETTMA